MIFIGIDPGKSGAIAFIKDRPSLVAEVWTIKASSTLHDLADELRAATLDDCAATIENVHSSPQMGVKSAFSFGQSYGQLEALLAALGIPYGYVSPAKWQGDMKCRTKGDKNVTKAAAQRLFPTVKITHANADALLIAEWGRRNR